MSHRHTVIEPANGLTVLVGPNNCGKSAVIAALQILAHNENSTYVTRHGEKICSVAVQTDDGHEIVWSRKNSSTSYTIDGKLFDRLRKGVPDELKDTLRLPKVDLNTSNDQIDIHFGTQKQPVFLLNEPGRSAAGFFAASSDAGRLIEMQKVHKEKVRDKKQDAKRLERETEDLQDEVNALQQVDTLAKLLSSCEKTKTELIGIDQQTHRLRSLIRKLQLLDSEHKCCLKRQSEFDRLLALPILTPTKELGVLVEKVEDLTRRKKILNRVVAKAEQLKEPPQVLATDGLKSKISEVNVLTDRLRYAERACEALDSIPNTMELPDLSAVRKLLSDSTTLTNRMAKLNEEDCELRKRVGEVEGEIKKFVELNTACPTCLQPLNSDNVVRHLKQGEGCRED